MNIQPNPYRPAIIRHSLVTMMSHDRYGHAITLTLNRGGLGVDWLNSRFKVFCHEIDRLKFNRVRVSKVPSTERLHAIAVPEKVNTNAHLHVVADLGFMVARGYLEADIAREVDVIWAKVTNGSGTSDVQPIANDGWAWYATKESFARDHQYFLSSDYHPF